MEPLLHSEPALRGPWPCPELEINSGELPGAQNTRKRWQVAAAGDVTAHGPLEAGGLLATLAQPLQVNPAPFLSPSWTPKTISMSLVSWGVFPLSLLRGSLSWGALCALPQ